MVVGLAVTEMLADAMVMVVVFEIPCQVAVTVATFGVASGFRVTVAVPSEPVDSVDEESVPPSVVNESEAPTNGFPPTSSVTVI